MAMTAPEENYSTLFERTKLLEWCVEFYHQIPEPSWQETGLASLAGAERTASLCLTEVPKA